MGKFDLHIHSTASDGRFSPEEIVRKSAELGLTIISIADHDCIDGVAPALLTARAFPRLRVIPNVEISTEHPDGEVAAMVPMHSRDDGKRSIYGRRLESLTGLYTTIFRPIGTDEAIDASLLAESVCQALAMDQIRWGRISSNSRSGFM